MQQYYLKFQNLSESNQRKSLAIISLLLNWFILSWFPINVFFIYILARGFTINNNLNENRTLLDIVKNMYLEILYLLSLVKYYYKKIIPSDNARPDNTPTSESKENHISHAVYQNTTKKSTSHKKE